MLLQYLVSVNGVNQSLEPLIGLIYRVGTAVVRMLKMLYSIIWKLLLVTRHSR